MAGNGRLSQQEISIRERKLIKARLDGKSVAEAAKISGYNPDYTSVVLKKPEIQERFASYLDRAGLTDSALSKRIKELAFANETKFFSHNGVVIEEKIVPALETQRKTIEFACKLKGHVVDKVEQDLSPGLMDRLFMVPCKPSLDSWGENE